MERLQNGKPLRWGIISCSLISNDFIRAMEYCEHLHKVVAVATKDDKNRASEYIEKLDVAVASDAVAYGSYQELIDDPDVDVIYIGNLNDAHFEWTIKTLEAKKPVLCEKPLAGTINEVKKMVEVARQNKVFLMEAVWSRFFPAWRYIRELVDSRKYGAPKMTNTSFCVVLPGSRWSAEQSESPLIDIGIYALTFSLFVFNSKAPEKVFTATRKGGNGLDDWGSFVLDYGDGTHSVCYYNGTVHGPTSAAIAFEKGQVEIPEFFWNPNRLTEIETPFKNGVDKPKIVEFPLHDEKTRDKFNFDNGSGMRYEADHVFECLQKGKLESDIMSLDETVRVLEIMQRVREEMGIKYKQDSENK